MNFRLLKLSPFIVAGAVGVGLVLLEYATERVPAFDFMRRLEWVTFDWRVRQSLRFDQPAAANLGVVYIDDKTLQQVQMKLKTSWPFPRWLHGAVLKELTDQKVAGVAYDIFFLDERPADKPVLSTTPGQTIPSDRNFADEISRNGHVILGAPDDPLSASRLRLPAPLFDQAAAAVGHAIRITDADGVVRRVQPVFIDADHRRFWHLGLQLAARQMGLDLDRALINDWKILVPDAANQMHEIPLDGQGRLVIRWALRTGAPALREAEMTEMLGAARHRQKNPGVQPAPWQGRLVVVGSAGTNPPIADRGPTPTGPATPYCSIYWNVANTVLTGGYVHTMNLWTRLLIIGVLVPLIGLLSWRIRAAWSTLAVCLVAAVYLAFCMWSYVAWGWWLPVALPLIGAIFVTYSSMVVYRFFFERNHRRRLRGLFGPLLAPDALELLLQQPNVSWAPQEKVMTVIFADIRGFTAFTDSASETTHGGPDAEQRAVRGEREALATVNVYLAAIVETLKQHGATMDKYMGDAVMAFWGAPLPQPNHAAASVRAAIAAQRAIAHINEDRQRENVKLTALNLEHAARGEPPLPLLPTLTLGTGINTGRMTVGFMGSEAHLSNYTVFGRAVNIASRLEGASGSGRIFITEETRAAAVLAEPALAECMRPFGEVTVKGIAAALAVIEVLWREDDAGRGQEGQMTEN